MRFRASLRTLLTHRYRLPGRDAPARFAQASVAATGGRDSGVLEAISIGCVLLHVALRGRQERVNARAQRHTRCRVSFYMCRSMRECQRRRACHGSHQPTRDSLCKPQLSVQSIRRNIETTKLVLLEVAGWSCEIRVASMRLVKHNCTSHKMPLATCVIVSWKRATI